jgi:tetratricopeptide (TPR) repeat protein
MSTRPLAYALLTLLALPPAALARAEPGTSVDDVELTTVTGTKEKLLSPKVKANVFVFFRTGQERSVDALKQMAQCEKDFAGKSVHWAAVVSSSEPPEDVRALVKETGIQMPVLVDKGDALYEALGIRLHPVVGIVDAKFKLQALEPYRQIDYCDIVKTRIRMLLGESTQAELDKVMNPEASPLPGADPVNKAVREVNYARHLFKVGKYQQALEKAQKALETAPVADAFVVMGQSYAKLGKCPEASRALDQAAKLDPANAEVAAARALCLK